MTLTESTESLDPELLGKEAHSTLHSLTGEQLALLLGVKKLSQLKYPLSLSFEHKRFKLHHIDAFDELGETVKRYIERDSARRSTL